MNRSTSLMALGLLATVTLFAATAQAQNLLANGTFTTGSLAPWTPVITLNGTNGAGLPNVVMFNNADGGVTYAAQFNVGQAISGTGQQGGGINQIFTVSTAGTYNFSAHIASSTKVGNAGAGTFSIGIDGTTLASISLGNIGSNQILKHILSGSVSLTSGSHMFEVIITRDYTSDNVTPHQTLTNISLSLQ